MTNDAISARERLARLDPDRWEHQLAMLFFALAIVIALMCENVNAAPQSIVPERIGPVRSNAEVDRRGHLMSNGDSGDRAEAETQPQRWSATSANATATSSVGAAPFMLAHPLCQTGFTIAQRYDQRNAAGAIIKSVWVRKCVRVPKIIYGGKI